MKTVETWFLWLMIYSIIGWVYESTICSIGHRRLINRGFLNGPYCPIYGTGAVLVLLVLGRIRFWCCSSSRVARSDAQPGIPHVVADGRAVPRQMAGPLKA